MLGTEVEVKVHEDEQAYNLTKKESICDPAEKISLVGMCSEGVACLEPPVVQAGARHLCRSMGHRGTRQDSGSKPAAALDAWVGPWEWGCTGRLEPALEGFSAKSAYDMGLPPVLLLRTC